MKSLTRRIMLKLAALSGACLGFPSGMNARADQQVAEKNNERAKKVIRGET